MTRATVPTARNPFEVVMLFGLLAVGAPYLFGIETSQAMEEMLHHAGTIWGGAVVLSAAASLLGITLHDARNSLVVEQVGLLGVGVCALFYAFVVLLANLAHPQPAIVSIGLGASYGVSCLWRFCQLQSIISRAVARMEDGD